MLMHLSVTPETKARFDAYCTQHGGLPRGRALALLLDELQYGTIVAPVPRHPDLGPEPASYPNGETAPKLGERVYEPDPHPWTP